MTEYQYKYELIEVVYINAMSDIIKQIKHVANVDSWSTRSNLSHYYSLGSPTSRFYIIDKNGYCEEVM